ncbi:hypothetical protein NIES4102_01070 [Chondrocystis sp. NIES-4102]|nr:hypothetical protein NIES4102_01070 [Chondrocystis sp. NIES-4102]
MNYKNLETELILRCSTTEINPNSIIRIKEIIEQDIDWDYFITTAKIHKVAPLVFVNIIKIASKVIPSDKLSTLQTFIRSLVIKNLYIIKELIYLMECFESNNIPAIPYKGVILAAAFYKDPSLRQFTDLDFLVPREKYIETQQLLMSLGYQAPPQTNVDWERGFINPQKQIAVDLHQGLTRFSNLINIDFTSFCDRLESVLIGGVEVKSFSSEDMLIVLCVQLAKDSQWTAEVLIKVCDIAQLLRANPALDWQLIWQRCKKLGTRRILLFSLSVTKEMLEIELPDLITQKIQADQVVQKAALQVCQEFFDRSEESFLNRTFKERIYLRKLFRERWQDKISYNFKKAVTPNERDQEVVELPTQLSFIYYFLRPIRLTFKYLNRLF